MGIGCLVLQAQSHHLGRINGASIRRQTGVGPRQLDILWQLVRTLGW